MRMVVTVRVWAVLYKLVVHTVLLYGSEIWVVTGEMLKVLEVFHHWVSRGILGRTAWWTVDGECKLAPVVDALEIAGLWPIKGYI